MMGDTSAIEWTGKTWNPWQGCHKVSPGCAHCYMYRDKIRYGQDPSVVVRSKTTFNAPLKWKNPDYVFTCSWSDWFIDEADAWRDEAWDIIRQTPHLTYQILTKRPARILGHLPTDWGDGYPNVWLGVTVENQRWAQERIPILLNVPAIVRFLSCEPLLKALNITPWLNGIQWVITGGESGPRYRPVDAVWLRSLRDQCLGAGVAFFFKQWSGTTPKSRGKLLDGQEWCQFPEVVR